MINQTMYKQHQKSKELVQGRKQDFKWAGQNLSAHSSTLVSAPVYHSGFGTWYFIFLTFILILKELTGKLKRTKPSFK